MDAEIEAVRALARASSVLERASPDLSLAHYRVLSAIASGNERASHVASRLALGRPAVSAAVDSLSQRGLIERYEVNEDQRASGLRLTPSGDILLAEVEREMRERIRDLCRRTPDGDRLLEALGWLGRAVDERRAEKRSREAVPAAAAPPGAAARPGAVAPPGAAAQPGAVARPGAVAPPGAAAQPGAVAPPGAVAQPGAAA